MLLRIAGQFCATRPFYVIGFWILLMVAAGAVSQVYLEDALSNGPVSYTHLRAHET